MGKLFLIARSNMRKAKGQTIAIIVLIFIASLMLNLWLMLATDYRANFDRYHDTLNAQDITITINDNDGSVAEFVSELLQNDNRITEYSLDRCLHMTGTFPYNGGTMNSWFVYVTKEQALSFSMGKIEIVEDSDISSGIYMPMIYKSNDIDIGKTLEMNIGSYKMEYTICGFFNSIMAGSHNCGLAEIIMTEDKYTELNNLGYAPKATLCSIRIKDRKENLNLEAELKSIISEHFHNIMMVSNSYDMVVQARYISQMICSGIMSAMAFFVLLIALVVIASNIINYIQVNMKNLGTLKATGYTSKQLICALLMQFLGLTFFAAIIGTGVSYAIFPALNNMMIAQTGIPYAIRFLPIPVLISIAILCGAVAVAVWLSSRRIKKIEPIVALRSGVQTHNFKQNHFPLEKTRIHLNLALAFKTTLSGIKHNITICITMIMLSVVVVFSGLMTANMIADSTPFITLIVGETADSCISVTAEKEEEFLQKINEDNRVEKSYLYTTINVTHSGGAELLSTVCNDFSLLNNQGVVYKGRFPKYENEIAIGARYAKENNFNVGDEIEITSNGKIEKYLICGLTQVTNYLGRDCLFTREGYERLGTLTDFSYYLNLADNVDIEEFNSEVKEAFDGSINTTINIRTTVESGARVYVALMTIIVIAILILSAIIIAFVLYLLVRTMLNNKKHDYGILKSLGFTTKQLVFQTATSFMPAIIISTIVGLIVNCIIINPLLSLFFSSLGILKCSFTIPIGFIAIAGIVIILLSFGIACLLSLKVKKIAPRTLLVGE